MTYPAVQQFGALVLETLPAEVPPDPALRRFEEHLALIQEAVDLGVHEYDLASGEFHCDARMRKCWGIGPGESITHDTFLAYVHSEDRAALRAATEGALDPRGDGKYAAEYRIIRRDNGAERWIAATGRVLFAHGRPVRLLGTVQDITERRRAAEAQATSVRRIELLARTAGELLRSNEPQNVVETLCRQVMEHLDCHAFFNFLADPAAGRLRLNACAGIPPEEARRIEWLDYGTAVCGCAARDGCRIVAEHIPATSDPRTDLVKSYGIKAYACHPLLGHAGEVIGTLSFGTRNRETFSPDDLALMKAVTDHVAVAMVRQQTDQALRAARASAEQARAVAETANRAKDQFIAVLSHELRTPLTPAVTAMSLLRTDVRLPADVREDLEMVSRNLDLEVRLIADLLDVSRIISGKLHLDKRPVDVVAAIREAAAIVSGDLDAKGQTLSIDTPGAPYRAFADAARLQQVFWNLFRNAIKFSPERSRITVRARVLPPPGPCPAGRDDCRPPEPDPACDGTLVVEVIDQGSGIHPDMLPKLFTPFEQEQKARSFGGLGLGLSICKAVVEMHGGSISAHSAGIGCGAAFTIRLPVARCAPDSSGPPGPEQLAGNGKPARDSHRPLCILLVEDHEDTARLMRRLLTVEGHEVVTANSVAAGLAAVRRHSPDILLSDLGLPDGSGLDLIRQLVARGDRLPAIALSGFGTSADIEKSRAAGFAEHLIKPLHSVDLLHAAIARLDVRPQPKITPGPSAT